MSIEKVKHKVNETISDENVVQRGKWYWMVVKEDGEAKEELFCATKILSNAVEMTNCYGGRFRVLLKDFEGRPELDPEGHFRRLVDRSTKKANEIRGEIEALTKCLGVGNNEPVETSTALAVGNLSSSEAKAALVLAKGKTLPAFEILAKRAGG